MAHIDSDVCHEIFLRLPAKYVVRSRAVCKSWRAVIDHPSFARALTNKQLSSNTNILIGNSIGPPFILFDLETLNFTDCLQKIVAYPLDYTRTGLPTIFQFPLAACDGLILVTPEESEENWVILNPLTHERLELPQRDSPALSRLAARGIGYDCAADDYKAVVITRDDVYETRVYSLKSDSWRKIMNFPFPVDEWGLNDTRGVFLNGALHWMSWNMIFVLDLGTETYRPLKLPPLDMVVGLIIGKVQLDALGGCLVVSDYGKDDYCFSQFDVWVMKDYGAEDSWMKLISLHEDIPRLSADLRVVAYMKDKMQFFLQSWEGLFLFDVESNSVKMVAIHGISTYLRVQVFDGSVFQLHDNCNCGVISGSVTTERRIKEMKREVKMTGDAELLFCVRDVDSFYDAHDSCYKIESTCYFSSEEDDEDDDDDDDDDEDEDEAQ